MALDKEYFDSINTKLEKSKYYDANEVRAVLEEIRTQVAAVIEENVRLKAELEALSKRSAQDKVCTGTGEPAASGVKDDDALIEDGVCQQEYAVKRVERCIARLRENQLRSVELINLEWQSFLCGLDSMNDTAQSRAPADLDDKLSAIEREMRMINEDK